MLKALNFYFYVEFTKKIIIFSLEMGGGGENFKNKHEVGGGGGTCKTNKDNEKGGEGVKSLKFRAKVLFE